MIPLLIRGESDQFDLTGEELSLFQMMASGFPYLTGGEQRTEFQATQRIVFSTKQSGDQSLLGEWGDTGPLAKTRRPCCSVAVRLPPSQQEKSVARLVEQIVL